MNNPVQNGLVADMPSASALAGKPKDIAQILALYRAVDAAEALNRLDREVAARVLEAMPVPSAIQILNEPNLDRSAKLIELLPVDCAPAILVGLHPDRRADIFRELPESARTALAPRLPKPTRETLDQLLGYPPQSAGGLMTTDFVSVPANWTVKQTLDDIHDVGENREVVYTVCLLDPETKRLVRTLALWRLVAATDAGNACAAGDGGPLSTTAGTNTGAASDDETSSVGPSCEAEPVTVSRRRARQLKSCSGLRP